MFKKILKWTVIVVIAIIVLFVLTHFVFDYIVTHQDHDPCLLGSASYSQTLERGHIYGQIYS